MTYHLTKTEKNEKKKTAHISSRTTHEHTQPTKKQDSDHLHKKKKKKKLITIHVRAHFFVHPYQFPVCRMPVQTTPWAITRSRLGGWFQAPKKCKNRCNRKESILESTPYVSQDHPNNRSPMCAKLHASAGLCMPTTTSYWCTVDEEALSAARDGQRVRPALY